MRLAAIALGAALWPGYASAHLVGVEFGDFYAGALHVVSGPADLAMLIGLGVIAGFQPRERARWMLAALPLGIAIGASLGVLAPDLLATQSLIPAGLALLGLAGAAALRVSTPVLIALAAAAAFVHGHANGQVASVEDVDRVLYVTGVAMAGTLIGTLAIAVASVLIDRTAWTPIGARVLASWVAAVGTVVFGLSVAG